MNLTNDLKYSKDEAKELEVVDICSVILRIYGEKITEYYNDILDSVFLGTFQLDFNDLYFYPDLSKGLVILIKEFC